jgi:hypothetical protein
VTCDWVPPSPIFKLLPWLALCLLLLLKQNRAGSAWWIWAAVLASLGMQSLAAAGLGLVKEMESNTIDMLMQVARVLMLGFAGWWLVAPLVSFRNKFLAFLGSLGVVMGLNLVFVLIDTEAKSRWELMAIAAMMGGICVLAFHLSGWFCRRRFGVARFILRLPVALVSAVVLVLGIFAAIAGASGHWSEVALGMSILTAFLLVLLLPYVVLCLGNGFYRERLKDLLIQIPKENAAAVPPPPPATPEMISGLANKTD